MPEIRCTVSNCEYWADGNECAADSILITAGGTAGKERHGHDAQRLGHTPVQIAQDSFCLTFEARQQGAEEESDDEVAADLMIPPLV